jgi:putative spermidine/putrescine transport system permease protein
VVGLFLIAPTGIVIILSRSADPWLHFPPSSWSLHWYENFFASDTWRAGAITSFEVGVASAVLCGILGTLAGIGIVRGRYPARAVVGAIILSPLVVPVMVVAIGTYFVFNRWGLTGSLPGLIVAHSALGLPFVVINVATVLRTIDPTLEFAAAGLGASPRQVLRRITLPLVMPGVVAGALFAFVTSWDEIVVALFISSPLVRTLPVVMWSQIRDETDPTVAAVSTLLTLVTVVILLLVATTTRWRAR